MNIKTNERVSEWEKDSAKGISKRRVCVCAREKGSMRRGPANLIGVWILSLLSEGFRKGEVISCIATKERLCQHHGWTLVPEHDMPEKQGKVSGLFMSR